MPHLSSSGKPSEDIFPRQWLRLAARYAGVRPAKAPLELSLLGLTGKKFSAKAPERLLKQTEARLPRACVAR
jgi:hypothetical protein